MYYKASHTYVYCTCYLYFILTFYHFEIHIKINSYIGKIKRNHMTYGKIYISEYLCYNMYIYIYICLFIYYIYK